MWQWQSWPATTDRQGGTFSEADDHSRDGGHLEKGEFLLINQVKGELQCGACVFARRRSRRGGMNEYMRYCAYTSHP